MRIQRIKLKNFRCFRVATFDITKNIVVIEGDNGSGKTSLLEAIHYACYLKSFRTRNGRELVHFSSDHFFLQIDFEEQIHDVSHQVHVGFSHNTKVVRFNNKPINSYKDIVASYRVISSTEEDVQLVAGAPEIRRSFLNHALMLESLDVVSLMRTYRQILHQRNSLLRQSSKKQFGDLVVWSQQLWDQSQLLQKKRIAYLARLEEIMNKLLQRYFVTDEADISMKIVYEPKYMKPNEQFEKFWHRYEREHVSSELRLQRGLFGAHLDDFSIQLHQKRAKQFASRGQQKLVVFLMKIAQLQLLEGCGKPACLLLDDFLTDFDHRVLERCLTVLGNLTEQVFVTSPLKSFIFLQKLPLFDVQIITM